jgi:hypothetical protein
MRIPGTSWGIYDLSIDWRFPAADLVLLMLVVISVLLLKRRKRRS